MACSRTKKNNHVASLGDLILFESLIHAFVAIVPFSVINISLLFKHEEDFGRGDFYPTEQMVTGLRLKRQYEIGTGGTTSSPYSPQWAVRRGAFNCSQQLKVEAALRTFK